MTEMKTVEPVRDFTITEAIQAMRLTASNRDAVRAFTIGADVVDDADEGDWIVKGHAGRLFVVNNERFLATYRPVDGTFCEWCGVAFSYDDLEYCSDADGDHSWWTCKPCCEEIEVEQAAREEAAEAGA